MCSDIVIVVGCYVPGQAVVRALANKGIHIIAISNSGKDIAHLSKHVNEVVHLPHHVNQDDQLIDCLLQNADRWNGALVLESEDYWSICISKHKDMLLPHYKIVTPDWSILSKFIEKDRTYAIANECQIPHPRNFPLASTDDLENIVHKLSFPFILKPTLSHEFKQIHNVKNFKVNNKTELKEKFYLCANSNQSMIAQEIIQGPDSNIFKMHGYINSHGSMKAKFFYRKIRQNPPTFGVMRVGISTERDYEVEQLSAKLLNYVNYKGYFNTEFKRDPRDNELKLMEVNVRMPRGGTLPLASGINYPWIIYQDLVKNQQIDSTNYKKGVYWIELYADIFNTIFRHGKENIDLRDYVKPYIAIDKAFAVWDIHDIKPFLKLSYTLVSTFLRTFKKPKNYPITDDYPGYEPDSEIE